MLVVQSTGQFGNDPPIGVGSYKPLCLIVEQYIAKGAQRQSGSGQREYLDGSGLDIFHTVAYILTVC